MVLLEINNLKKYFPIRAGLLSRTSGEVKAIDDISFKVQEGETLGLVGESGCGKTTLGRCILGTISPTSGSILFEGEDIANKQTLERHRKDIQMVFQDPYSSLTPHMTVADIVWEPIAIHKKEFAKTVNKEEELIKIFQKVGLADYHIYRYPHELSGGQKQRVAIARAIALNPKLVLCDEPVANLDVSIGAQILNIMDDLQNELKLTYIFISHNLSLIYHISDNVAVMYLGKMVEVSTTDKLFEDPLHPYTIALLSAVPSIDPNKKVKRIILEGDVPTPINPPSGCRFRTRCWLAQTICKEKEPLLEEVEAEHHVACHFWRESKKSIN
jgi:oligopeptide transport system ATP-binding protein